MTVRDIEVLTFSNLIVAQYLSRDFLRVEIVPEDTSPIGKYNKKDETNLCSRQNLAGVASRLDVRSKPWLWILEIGIPHKGR